MRIFGDNLKTQLIIPKAVESECTSKKDTYDAKLITQRIIEKRIIVQKSSNLKIRKKLMRDFNIANGEAEALTLCLDKNQLLLTDDKKAINACKILHLPFATAPNILIRAYEKGLIVTLISPLDNTNSTDLNNTFENITEKWIYFDLNWGSPCNESHIYSNSLGDL